jgi:hypothetical protein
LYATGWYGRSESCINPDHKFGFDKLNVKIHTSFLRFGPHLKKMRTSYDKTPGRQLEEHHWRTPLRTPFRTPGDVLRGVLKGVLTGDVLQGV